MINKPFLNRSLKYTVIMLVVVLTIANIFYIKTSCSTTQCYTTNTFIVILLLWAAIFWLFILKDLNKKE
ncbi:MAG: hypothetical protein ABIG92_03070 [Candidatus Omnitrophota bacterium]